MTHTTTCCEKCLKIPDGRDARLGIVKSCLNMYCPCHSTTQGDYHKHDHSHCWESKNPPCGQKIKHFECCLCKELNPDVFRFSGGGGGNSKKNWGEDRKNLYDFLQKFPHRGFDVIDSAYLAGLDARSAELHQERQRFGREIIICSAVKFGDVIVQGRRHSDCIQTAHGMGLDTKHISSDEGFITSQNRFVGRKEARKIHVDSNQVPFREIYTANEELYSEDLY